MDKHQKLFELARKRKHTRWVGYKCISDFHGGFFECEYVSPYTKGANNVDSDIMIILQDWSSDAILSAPLDQNAIRNNEKYGYDPSRSTNANLNRLLNGHFRVQLKDVYATNLFPFIKSGNISSPIPQRDLIRAAIEFALPQIRIICPKLVVCLGAATFNAIRRACRYNDWLITESAIVSPFMFHRSQIWCQAHTSQLGQNNRNKGGVDRVSSDWERMKKAIFSYEDKVPAIGHVNKQYDGNISAGRKHFENINTASNLRLKELHRLGISGGAASNMNPGSRLQPGKPGCSPHGHRLESQPGRIDDFAHTYKKKNGKWPSPAETAKGTGLSERRCKEHYDYWNIVDGRYQK
jgi:hypothetical protein